MNIDRNDKHYDGGMGGKLGILDEITQLVDALDNLMEDMGEVQYLLDRLNRFSGRKDNLRECYETGESIYDAMDMWVDEINDLAANLELAGYLGTTKLANQKRTNSDATVTKVQNYLRSIGETGDAYRAGKVLDLYNAYFK